MGDMTYNSAEKVVSKPGFDGPFINPPMFSEAGIAHRQKAISTTGVDPYMARGRVPSKIDEEDKDDSSNRLFMGMSGLKPEPTAGTFKPRGTPKSFPGGSARAAHGLTSLNFDVKEVRNVVTAYEVFKANALKMKIPADKIPSLGDMLKGGPVEKTDVLSGKKYIDDVKPLSVVRELPVSQVQNYARAAGTYNPSAGELFVQEARSDWKSGVRGGVFMHEMVHRAQDVSPRFDLARTTKQLLKMFGAENQRDSMRSVQMIEEEMRSRNFVEKYGQEGYDKILARQTNKELMAYGLQHKTTLDDYDTMFDPRKAKGRNRILGKGAGARIDRNVRSLKNLDFNRRVAAGPELPDPFNIQTGSRTGFPLTYETVNPELINPSGVRPGAARPKFTFVSQETGRFHEGSTETQAKVRTDTRQAGSPIIESSGKVPQNFELKPSQRPASYKPESFARGSLNFGLKALGVYGTYQAGSHLTEMGREARTTGNASSQLGDERAAVGESILGAGAGATALLGAQNMAAGAAARFGMSRVAAALAAPVLGIGAAAAAPLTIASAVLFSGYEYFKSQQQLKLLEKESEGYAKEADQVGDRSRFTSIARNQTQADSLAETIKFLKDDQEAPPEGAGKNNQEKIQKLEEYRQSFLDRNQRILEGQRDKATRNIDLGSAQIPEALRPKMNMKGDMFQVPQPTMPALNLPTPPPLSRGGNLIEKQDRGLAYLKSLGVPEGVDIDSEDLYHRLNPEINIAKRKAAMEKAYTELEATQRAEKLDKLSLGDRIKALQADIAWNKNPTRGRILEGELGEAVLDYDSYAGAINYVDSYKNKVVQSRIGLINRSFDKMNSPKTPKRVKEELDKLIRDEISKLPNKKGEGGQFDFFTLVDGKKVPISEEDYIKKMAASNREKASKNKAPGPIPSQQKAAGHVPNFSPKEFIENSLAASGGYAAALGRVPNFAAGMRMGAPNPRPEGAKLAKNETNIANASPGAAAKTASLKELLQRYLSDKITPREYHEQRDKILGINQQQQTTPIVAAPIVAPPTVAPPSAQKSKPAAKPKSTRRPRQQTAPIAIDPSALSDEQRIGLGSLPRPVTPVLNAGAQAMYDRAYPDTGNGAASSTIPSSPSASSLPTRLPSAENFSPTANSPASPTIPSSPSASSLPTTLPSAENFSPTANPTSPNAASIVRDFSSRPEVTGPISDFDRMRGDQLNKEWEAAGVYIDRDERRANMPIPNYTGENFRTPNQVAAAANGAAASASAAATSPTPTPKTRAQQVREAAERSLYAGLDYQPADTGLIAPPRPRRYPAEGNQSLLPGTFREDLFAGAESPMIPSSPSASSLPTRLPPAEMRRDKPMSKIGLFQVQMEARDTVLARLKKETGRHEIRDDSWADIKELMSEEARILDREGVDAKGQPLKGNIPGVGWTAEWAKANDERRLSPTRKELYGDAGTPNFPGARAFGHVPNYAEDLPFQEISKDQEDLDGKFVKDYFSKFPPDPVAQGIPVVKKEKPSKEERERMDAIYIRMDNRDAGRSAKEKKFVSNFNKIEQKEGFVSYPDATGLEHLGPTGFEGLINKVKDPDEAARQLDSFKTLTEKIGPELEKTLKEGYNPKSTNWNFSALMPTDQTSMGKSVAAMNKSFSDAPNTLTASGHGLPSLISQKGSGLMPDSSVATTLSDLVRSRQAVLNKNFTDLINKSDTTEGGISMEEIARGIGSQTNDVKRIVLTSCYAAGYDFATIKKYFPNLEELITSSSLLPIIASPRTPMFSRKPGDDGHRSITGEKTGLNKVVSPFYRITETSTNEIKQASDWIGNKPPAWFKFQEGPPAQAEDEINQDLKGFGLRNKALGSIPEFNQAFSREENALRARGVSNPKDLIYAGTSPRITSNAGNLGVFNRLDEPNGPADAFPAMGRVPNFAASSTDRPTDTIASLRESATTIMQASAQITSDTQNVVATSSELIAAFSKPQTVTLNANAITLDIKHSGTVDVKDSQTVIAEIAKVRREIDTIAADMRAAIAAAIAAQRNPRPAP